jgi:proteasome lid subunit RPN8/RPN11
MRDIGYMTLPDRASVPKWLIDFLSQQVKLIPDEREVCGLIFSKNGRVVRTVAIPNASDQHETFEMENGHLLAALQNMEMRGEAIWGVYHTHPRGPAGMSRVDVEYANLPAYYIVVSPGNVTCWRMVQETYEDEVIIGVKLAPKRVELLPYVECGKCGGLVYA